MKITRKVNSIFVYRKIMYKVTYSNAALNCMDCHAIYEQVDDRYKTLCAKDNVRGYCKSARTDNNKVIYVILRKNI